MKSFWKQSALTLALLAFAASGVAGDLCDPGLKGSPASPAAYRQRGDRCEGIYALQVSSTQIRLVSIVETFAYDPKDPEALEVSWARPAGDYGPVRLRAQSLQPNTFYRMDTSIDAGRTFQWPSDILASLRLPPTTVGVLGWTRLAGEERDVYLPLRISQGQAPAGGSEYQVAVIPDHRLREIYLTLTPLGGAGGRRPPVFEKKPLGYGLYMAKEATVFSLSKPQESGLYEVEIVCEIWSGGSMTTSFTFYQS